MYFRSIDVNQNGRNTTSTTFGKLPAKYPLEITEYNTALNALNATIAPIESLLLS